MVWALILAITLAMPAIALADDEVVLVDEGLEVIVDDDSEVVDGYEVEQEPEQEEVIQTETESTDGAVDVDMVGTEVVEPDTETQVIKLLLQDVANEQDEEPEVEPESEPLKVMRSGVTRFVAYSSVNPTSQYASLALRMIPKTPWSEHYCFLQDTTNSYVYVWGDLSIDGDAIVGDDCKYRRWYYGGQGIGYVVEDGTGSVNIDPNGHEVLSSLGDYPAIDGGESEQRYEIAFYAAVAAAVSVLGRITDFLLRYRNAGVGIRQ